MAEKPLDEDKFSKVYLEYKLGEIHKKSISHNVTAYVIDAL